MPLKLLHLSDIHFKCYKEHTYLDLDKDIQRELEIDLGELKSNYGNIDIILIGGDIAFSGREDEYQIADEWIKKICEITGCDQENVLTIPGNHDIDRTKVKAMVKDAHLAFKALRKRNEIDKKILHYVTNQESAELLLSPLANYNAFAQKYRSIASENNILYWEKDFTLDSSTLRIRGVNSAFISDDTDDEHDSKLALGTAQSNLLRNEGVINVVLCHHPPQWLYDGDEAQKDFKAKVRIQLFGHKHVFETNLIEDKSLVLSAGAMQPERAESGWEPRYNIIELAIPVIMQSPTLNIKLFKRVWDKNKRKFKADYSDNGSVFEEHNLTLSDHEVIDKRQNKAEKANNLIVTPMAEPIIDLNTPNPKRKLAFKFLGLPYHVKLRIAVELNLIDESDKDIGEVQRAQSYFKRAAEREILHDLWEKVDKALGEASINPFK